MESILGKTIAWTFPNLEGLLWVWVQCDSLSHLVSNSVLFFFWKQNSASDYQASLIFNFIFEEPCYRYLSSEHFTMRYVLIWAFFLIAGQFRQKQHPNINTPPPSHCWPQIPSIWKNIACFKTQRCQVNRPHRNNYRKMKMSLSCDIIHTGFTPCSSNWHHMKFFPDCRERKNEQRL